ncbi:transporter substrate-binding domain-containing protein [Streptomyces sp. MST-110588]|uniref:transporter substrate-binding domain-containing protein n=1 Tax=Streptomyces sp. MST-110588 TaxID=2833628 RepID=UPI001F5D92A8|nr:transporter substrate-binding domain-containing protein [Streptomyces sp. MST-110588]
MSLRSSRLPFPAGPTASIVVVALAAIALAGCSSTKTSGSGGKGVALVEPGKLKNCAQLPYEPFEVSKGGKIVGFDVDIVDLVAKKLNVTQDNRDTPFESILSGEAFNSNQCDLAAAGMTILPSRRKNLDFSDPYFTATQSLLVKKGAPYKSLADLKGRVLGVQQETTGEIYARKHAKGVRIKQFEDVGVLVNAVKGGTIPAAINDNGVLYDFARRNPDTQVTADFNTGEKYGIGVRKGNDALRNTINEVLKQAQADGTYERIYKKWFGTAPKK